MDTSNNSEQSAKTQASSKLPTFDRDDLIYRLSNDVELAQAVIKAFSAELPRIFTKLKLDLHNRDSQSAYIQVHTMKGSATNVGACALAELCRQVETITKAGEFPNDAQIEQISAELDELQRILMLEGRTQD